MLWRLRIVVFFESGLEARESMSMMVPSLAVPQAQHEAKKAAKAVMLPLHLMDSGARDSHRRL
jgi:hypothetical protein